MELPSQKRKQNIHLADTSGIPLYKLPPTDTISLEQFETLAQQRLKRMGMTTLFFRIALSVITSIPLSSPPEGGNHSPEWYPGCRRKR